MNGIVDLEAIGVDAETDTWIIRLPKEVCHREGFAEGTLVSMTIKDGGIISKFIRPPSKELQEISKRLIEKDRELHRRLREIGD